MFSQPNPYGEDKENMKKQNGWWKYDKRSRYNRHWNGKHTEDCEIYIPESFAFGCKYTRKMNFMKTDLMISRVFDSDTMQRKENI